MSATQLEPRNLSENKGEQVPQLQPTSPSEKIGAKTLIISLWDCLRSAPWVREKWKLKRPENDSAVPLKELTSEKNLGQVFISSLRIPPSAYALPAGTFVGILLSAYALLAAPPTEEWATLVRNWSESGIAFTTTTLGFLITGFTIFASLGSSRMFKAIALIREKKSGLPYLKYTFFGLVRVFIAFLLFAAFCFSIKIFFFPNGPIPAVLRLFPAETSEKLLRAIIGFDFVILGSGIVYTLISLSSFVYNVSYFVLHIVRWESENPADSESD